MPIASEYGITATFEEHKAFMEHLASDDEELNTEEIAQVAGGGKGLGLGATACFGIGVGAGGGSGSGCVGLGLGGGAQACWYEGQSEEC